MAENKETILAFVEAFLEKYTLQLEETITDVVEKILTQKHQELLGLIDEKAQIKLSDLKGEKGDPGKDGTKPILGVDYSIPAPIPGEPGKDADESKIIADVLKQIPAPIPGPPGKPGKDGTEIEGEEIVDKINVLPTDDESKKIDAIHIKNLPKYDKMGGGQIIRGGMEQVRQVDFSGSLDGSTKTFTSTTPVADVICLIGSEAPIVYRPTTHFTVSGNVITLTDAVTAPSAGSVLIAVLRSQ